MRICEQCAKSCGYAWTTFIGLAFLVSGMATAQDNQLEMGRSDEWHFNVTPYLWAAGIDGDVTVRGFELGPATMKSEGPNSIPSIDPVAFGPRALSIA